MFAFFILLRECSNPSLLFEENSLCTLETKNSYCVLCKLLHNIGMNIYYSFFPIVSNLID